MPIKKNDRIFYQTGCHDELIGLRMFVPHRHFLACCNLIQ